MHQGGQGQTAAAVECARPRAALLGRDLLSAETAGVLSHDRGR